MNPRKLVSDRNRPRPRSPSWRPAAAAPERRRERRQGRPRRLLDAQGGLRGAHPGLPEDRRRARASTFKPVLRRLRRPEPRGRGSGLPADVVALSLAPDIDKLVEAGIVAKDWDKDKYDGFVTNSVVVFAVRKGNPKNIKTWDDLTKPGVEVITPNPFTSGGAKWNVMAAYGAQIEQGKTEAAGERVPQAAVQERRRCRTRARRESLQTFARRQGRRAARLRERGDHRPAEGRGRRLRRPRPDDPDPEPDRGHRTRRTRAKAQGVRRLHAARDAGAEDLRREGLPPGRRGDWSTRRSSRPRRGLFTIDEFGGWSTVNDKFFDPDEGIVARSSRTLASPPASSPQPSRAAARAAPRARSVAAPLAGGVAVLYLSVIVLLPLAAVAAKSFDGGIGGFWDAGHRAAGGGGAQADADRLADRGR